MIGKFISLGLVLAATLLGAGACRAQDMGFSELRGGIMAHSVDDSSGTTTFGFLNLTRVQDANVELLFKPFDGLGWLGSPRPTVGATVNFGGLESQVYAGLTWHAQVFNTPFFVEGMFGAAATNGQFHNAVYPARSLGCPILFHEAASVGYDLTENADVMLTLEHASHAGLCGSDNRGLTDLGVRVGFIF